ncbi:unnamed protein product [Calypogeia fissa]
MEKLSKLVALWTIVLGGLVFAFNPHPFASGSRLRDAKPMAFDAAQWNSSSLFEEEQQAEEGRGSFLFPESWREEGNSMYDEHEDRTWIWPLPAEWSKGTTTLVVDAQLELVLEGNGGITRGSGIVADAFERYCKHMYAHQRDKDVLRKIRRRNAADGPSLQKLIVNILSSEETLNLGTDESYNLSVPAPGKKTEALLEAATVYGALRGLETFSQLVRFNFTKRQTEIAETPWVVKDEPRFKYRGLLIDTSRHYLPVETIRKVLDSMSYAKLNVLHWHIVDTESFPIEIPSYPDLWKGAYSTKERYTIDDARDIVEYARKRGINVMAELDVPGHAASWGKGYHELWPSATCQQPLDASKNFTFEVISSILADFRKVFPFDLVHLGGDEVDTSCWENTPHINQWLEDRQLTAQAAYAEFVLQAQTVALDLNWTPVNWEEPFDIFPDRLNPRTVIHEWLSNDIVPRIVEKGFKVIVSNQDVWYLDHLNVPWEYFYLNEPLTNVKDPAQQELVLGGEVCMWGETADPSDIEATIWPRAAAAAERLWSPASTTNSTTLARPRIHNFRCLLNERGVGAAPVENRLARTGPPYPGSCYDQ